jgi:single-stranded DNA-specific DHH superfamily exonuclease
MIRFLIKTKTPYEVLEDTNQNHSMHYRFDQIESKFQKFVEKASEIGVKSEKILFFQYGGDLSISSDIANALAYRFPDKFICVVYVAGIKANISVRGKKALSKVVKAIEGLEGATGGGHEEASGAQVKFDDLNVFRKRLEESFN